MALFFFLLFVSGFISEKEVWCVGFLRLIRGLLLWGIQFLFFLSFPEDLTSRAASSCSGSSSDSEKSVRGLPSSRLTIPLPEPYTDFIT